MSVRDVLIEAKKLISDENNWIKNNYTDSEGCFCAAGAVREATDWGIVQNGYTPEAEKAFWFLSSISKELYPMRGIKGNIIEFNDHPKTTHAEIISVFDEAIKRES